MINISLTLIYIFIPYGNKKMTLESAIRFNY